MDFSKFPFNILHRGRIDKAWSLPIQDEPAEKGVAPNSGVHLYG